MPRAEDEHAGFTNPLKVWKTLRRTHGPAFAATPRSAAHPMPWPAGFDPRKNPIYVRNDIAIGAPASEVFRRIARATEWPSYYPNSADVRLEGGATELRQGTKFEWTTFGTRQRSEVTLHDPDRAIGWTAKGGGVRAFHRWILEPAGDGRTLVVTEECQWGITAKLSRALLNPTMHAGHELWLERLKGVCESR